MCVFVGIYADLCVHALFLFPTCGSDAVLFFLAWNSFCPQGPDTRKWRKRPCILILSFSSWPMLCCLFPMKQKKHGCLGLASSWVGRLAVAWMPPGALSSTRTAVRKLPCHCHQTLRGASTLSQLHTKKGQNTPPRAPAFRETAAVVLSSL